jgi:capsular polysaccharide biosynthesis protein
MNLAGSGEEIQTVILTMIQAIDSRPVAEEVIGRLGLRMEPAELLDNLTIELVENTSFIVLRADLRKRGGWQPIDDHRV